MFSIKNNTEETASGSPSNAEVQQAGTVLAPKDGVVLSCLTVIGQIEGHYLLSDNQKTTKYEHVLPLLLSAEQDPIDQRDHCADQHNGRRR